MTDYFATVAHGLESIAAQELMDLGASDVKPGFTGVYFTGDQSLLYRVNLWARTIFRVLMPIAHFDCHNPKMLYREIYQIDWDEYLTPESTLAVSCTGTNPGLNHTHFTALQVKNAIIDQQRKRYGQRSNVDVQNPDLSLNLHLEQDWGILSLDSSGTSLHRRGYRPAMGVAPLKETLAAAILAMAEYSPHIPFLDPLCGSGTLPLEASLKALNIAPGLFRDQFCFFNWPDFDSDLWDKLKQEALDSQLSELPSIIMGSDREPDVLDEARINAQNCGVLDKIKLAQTDLVDLNPPADQGLIICNPPYGERLGDMAELADFYKTMGDVFKQRFKGWTAFILTGNKELSKKIGLKTAKRIPLFNGSIPCTLLKYELY